MEKEGKKKRIGMSKALEPDEFVKAMEEIESEVQIAFHSEAKVKELKEKQREDEGEGGEAPPRPGERGVRREVKRALVVIGALTGNGFVDTAMRNTALEALSDFNDRGYETTLLDQPMCTEVQSFLSDPNMKAFCFVGHGGDKKAGDSGDAKPGGRNGNDTMWPNGGEVISSLDIKRWMNGRTMDVVILHACVQGLSNTAKRWQTAFGVSADNYHSWIGLCRYHQAYWWQFYWT